MERVAQWWRAWSQIKLVQRILIGLGVGLLLAWLCPQWQWLGLLGKLFVSALKAMAPVLVFFLVMASLAQHRTDQPTNIKEVLVLYFVGMLLAALTSVGMDFLFKPTLVLGNIPQEVAPPQGLDQVLHNLIMSIVQNPVEALAQANYIGILFWATVIGLACTKISESSRQVLLELSEVLSRVIAWIIECAPFGVLGLIYTAVTVGGFQALQSYGRLILVLVGTMLIVALILNPLLVYLKLRRNPYPLVLKCLKDSGLTAFFTRSSAANIPVNMRLCEELKLDKATYSVSIPLGATINMEGAGVTIVLLTLAAVNTLGISVDLATSIILCILAVISACGTSGVAGGSLLLIPLACSLFGMDQDLAMQVVGVGFVISVIQDSCETALNSSADVLFTATAEFAKRPAREDS